MPSIHFFTYKAGLALSADRTIRALAVVIAVLIGCGRIAAPARTPNPTEGGPVTATAAEHSSMASLCDGHALRDTQSAAQPRRITGSWPSPAHPDEEITVSFEGFAPLARLEAVASTPGDLPWPTVASGRADATGAGALQFAIPTQAPIIEAIRRLGLPCFYLVIQPADTGGVYVGPTGEPHYAIAIVQFQY